MIKVAIEHYRPHKSDGAFQGFFTLVIYPEGLTIYSCKHFKNDTGDWFRFPEKAVEIEGETEWKPLLIYRNREYLEELKSAVYDELQKVNNDKNRKNTSPEVQGDAPSDWF